MADRIRQLVNHARRNGRLVFDFEKKLTLEEAWGRADLIENKKAKLCIMALKAEYVRYICMYQKLEMCRNGQRKFGIVKKFKTF
jgi:hypothetical protein